MMTGTDISLIIGQVAVLVTALASARVSMRNSRKLDQQVEKIERVETKVAEVHRSTNGLSERNEAIAKKLGIAEGKASERANPT